VVKVNLNTKKIERAAIEAFRDAAFLQGRVFTEVISEVGAFPAHPDRDLVDTGQLRSSQQLEFVRDTEARFVWPTDYAIYQHEGFTMRNGQRWEGRPWTTEGLKRFDLQGTIAKLMALKLK